jgi:hypothetical protein
VFSKFIPYANDTSGVSLAAGSLTSAPDGKASSPLQGREALPHWHTSGRYQHNCRRKPAGERRIFSRPADLKFDFVRPGRKANMLEPSPLGQVVSLRDSRPVVLAGQ